MKEIKNIVLITVDSLRRDALGCFGNARAHTPCLDRLSVEGVCFDQAITNGPRTPSAFPAILCSQYPLVTGEQSLPSDVPTLAGEFQRAGYATAAFNLDNPFLSPATGYGKGFDRFDDFWTVEKHAANGKRKDFWKRVKRAVQDGIGRRDLALLLCLQGLLQHRRGMFVRGREMTDRAVAWLKACHGKPFLLWVHYMETHYPYAGGNADSIHRRLRHLSALAGILLNAHRPAIALMKELYRNQVSHVDGMIGEIRDALDAEGLWEDTAFAVTADHGEMFREHGGYTHGPEFYDELLRVPLFLHAQGRLPAGLVRAQVPLLDLAPSLLDLAGLEPPSDFAGSSLLHWIRTREDNPQSRVFSQASHHGGRRSRRASPRKYRIVSCRTPEWKYIFDEEGPREELYNLCADPAELQNQASDGGHVLESFRTAVRDHLAAVEKAASRYTRRPFGEDLPEAENLRERLAALGYL